MLLSYAVSIFTRMFAYGQIFFILNTLLTGALQLTAKPRTRKGITPMQIIYDKDIFTISNNDKNANVVCVTTNNMIKRNGEAVMGAGIAKSVNERFRVGYKLANHLRVNGNTCADLGEYSYQNSTYHIVSFPTKDTM